MNALWVAEWEGEKEDMPSMRYYQITQTKYFRVGKNVDRRSLLLRQVHKNLQNVYFNL